MYPVAHDAFIIEIPPENVSIVHPAQTAAGSLNASAPPELCIDGFVEEPTRGCTLAARTADFREMDEGEGQSLRRDEDKCTSLRILAI